MKAIFAALFAATLFSVTVAEPVAELEERTIFDFKCPKTCKFPPLAIPKCSLLLPCHFDCKDGYIPHPLLKPTSCVCKWPLTECNGKCGIFKHCPSSGHHKRDLSPESVKCPVGFSACGVYGRSTDSWECLNTQKDLESCGGCIVPLKGDLNPQEGRDCTAIEGVSDVACVHGACEVKKCMDGYETNETRDSCVPVGRKKSIFQVAEEVLAAQFGA
ncbi:hypothetical protein BKA70DRAFT_516216 [Coprinopsis sp. MPI-PUGE-AT-0042]|nr:hypothetical protein BKA70DRAFT_280309 [Coprinopsis sp. MPI-PUGE-AT-0042]KAH6905002.1 hypothetical protein BKA70DRAFT_516216 [Coprinopsis sp. MPI-PUGE-AT-0042]